MKQNRRRTFRYLLPILLSMMLPEARALWLTQGQHQLYFWTGSVETSDNTVMQPAPFTALQSLKLSANSALALATTNRIPVSPPETNALLTQPDSEPAEFSVGLIQLQSAATVQVQYLHTDLLGSVVAESDASGNLTKTTHYKPFGEPGSN